MSDECQLGKTTSKGPGYRTIANALPAAPCHLQLSILPAAPPSPLTILEGPEDQTVTDLLGLAAMLLPDFQILAILKYKMLQDLFETQHWRGTDEETDLTAAGSLP